VRVPEAVGEGRVKVSLSFAEWKEGKVAPATFELPPPKGATGGANPD
jgi:hypothetical protein